MSDQFQVWAQFALSQEGGYVDNPDDHGGPTNRGVTMADLRRWSRRATVADLRALTVPETLGIMEALYWQPVRGWALPAGVSISVADHAYNAGVGTSARILQRIVGTEPDGVIGGITCLAVTGYHDPAGLIAKLHDAQLAYYQGLAQFAEFGDDWKARCDARRDLALANVMQPAF